MELYSDRDKLLDIWRDALGRGDAIITSGDDQFQLEEFFKVFDFAPVFERFLPKHEPQDLEIILKTIQTILQVVDSA